MLEKIQSRIEKTIPQKKKKKTANSISDKGQYPEYTKINN